MTADRSLFCLFPLASASGGVNTRLQCCNTLLNEFIDMSLSANHCWVLGEVLASSHSQLFYLRGGAASCSSSPPAPAHLQSKSCFPAHALQLAGKLETYFTILGCSREVCTPVTQQCTGSIGAKRQHGTEAYVEMALEDTVLERQHGKIVTLIE